MKLRFTLFKRGGVYYYEDTTTRKQTSLRTRDAAEANTLLHAKNESFRQPVLNLQIARTYLSACDPALSARTWQSVMEQIVTTKSEGPTRARWETAIKDAAFDSIRARKLVETSAEHLLAVLKVGKVSTNVYLRRIHNYALDMNWLTWSVIPKRQWAIYRKWNSGDVRSFQHIQSVVQSEFDIFRTGTKLYY